MTELQVLKPEQHTQWMDVLAQAFQHDFHHLPQYHALAEERGEGAARLFLCREGEYFIALPLLLRPIGAVPCHARGGDEWWDATCVYGYAGPIASHPDIPASILQDLQASLREALLERHIVTVFSRLHPLITSQYELLTGLGECISIGQTVSIDLTLPIEVQRARYRKDYKRQINRLERMGAICLHDESRSHLVEFTDMYQETMSRVQAGEGYFFDHNYFERLVSWLGSTIHLFVCQLDNRIVCGGLFTLCDGIVQAHLVGTRNEYVKLSPVKLLFDKVRLWANEHKAHVFHLGGGVGAQEDALFYFKAGFSDRRHQFAIWDWVLLSDMCDQLCQEKTLWGERCGSNVVGRVYHPMYRCPDCPYEGLSEEHSGTL